MAYNSVFQCCVRAGFLYYLFLSLILGSALAADLTLKREDLRYVAVYSACLEPIDTEAVSSLGIPTPGSVEESPVLSRDVSNYRYRTPGQESGSDLVSADTSSNSSAQLLDSTSPRDDRIIHDVSRHGSVGSSGSIGSDDSLAYLTSSGNALPPPPLQPGKSQG